MTRNQNHNLPAWVNALTRVLRPVAKAEASAARVNQRVGSRLFWFDRMIGLTSFWIGVNNRFSQSTWTCVWTPLSMWFRFAVFVPFNLLGLARERRRQAVRREREAREKAGEVKMTSIYDLRRVFRTAMGEARKGLPSQEGPNFMPMTAENPLSDAEVKKCVADWESRFGKKRKS
jgi:hypothetical protein